MAPIQTYLMSSSEDEEEEDSLEVFLTFLEEEEVVVVLVGVGDVERADLEDLVAAIFLVVDGLLCGFRLCSLSLSRAVYAMTTTVLTCRPTWIVLLCSK